jgi:hypothetical protein
MKKLFLIVTLIIVSFAFLSADVYIKQETKAGPQTSTQETWFGTNKMASISDQGSVIMDMANKKILIVNHKSKTYVEAGLPLDMMKLMPEQMAGMMQSMMSGMEVSLAPNGQTKKIGNWNTSGYDFTIKMMGMEIKMTMWASKDVPFDWKKYMDMSAEMYKVSMRMGDKFVKEFQKLEGYPVATEMSMMGMDINMTTVEITQKTPGSGVYAAPAGYTKTDKLSMGDMQGR